MRIDVVIVSLTLIILSFGEMYLFWSLGQILSDLARHEVALLELIRQHPEMIYSEEADYFNETERDNR